MNDREKFLFDLQGFLVVPDFLTQVEVDELNAAVDANTDKCGEDDNHTPSAIPKHLLVPTDKACSRAC